METSEGKSCTDCGKGLRRDNTKGICGDRKACAKRAAGEVKAPRGSAPKEARAEGPVQEDAAGGDHRVLFDALTQALGIDGEALIASATEEFCRKWVADLRAKAQPTVPVDEDDEPRRSLHDGDEDED